jgi:hypothetical protein
MSDYTPHPTRGSVARPTALDETTLGQLAALKRSLHRAEEVPAQSHRPNSHKGIPRSRLKAYWRTRAIRAWYADGQPLDPSDMAFMRHVLDRHPRAAQKIGAGVHAIVCGAYVGGSRCFFVIRTDGTIEDFSVRRCLGLPVTSRRSAKLLAMMARFSPEPLRRAFLAYRRSGQTASRPANEDLWARLPDTLPEALRRELAEIDRIAPGILSGPGLDQHIELMERKTAALQQWAALDARPRVRAELDRAAKSLGTMREMRENRERNRAAALRHPALAVVCPHCLATTGTPCPDDAGRLRLKGPHRPRRDLYAARTSSGVTA